MIERIKEQSFPRHFKISLAASGPKQTAQVGSSCGIEDISAFQDLAKILKVASMSSSQRILVDRVQQNDFVVDTTTIEIQFDCKPRLLRLLPLAIFKVAKGGNEPTLAPIILD